jgi:hypothetical protein
MKNPDVSLSGAVADALRHLRPVSKDDELREVLDAAPARAPFQTLLEIAVRHLQSVLDPHTGAPPTSFRGVDVAERSLAVLHAVLETVAHSEEYRSSLSARVGFDQLIDEVETAAEELRTRGNAANLHGLIHALDRETGAVRAS